MLIRGPSFGIFEYEYRDILGNIQEKKKKKLCQGFSKQLHNSFLSGVLTSCSLYVCCDEFSKTGCQGSRNP